MEITPPTIHLNGTPSTILYAGYLAAHDAIVDAISKFNLIEFHSRDYYVQDSGAFTKALDHRIEQRQALDQVEKYLLEHILAMQNKEAK